MDPAPVCVAAWQWFHYVRKCQAGPQNDHYICAWYHDIDHEYQYDYNILMAQFAPDLLLVTYKNIIYISILHGFKHGLNNFNLNFSEWVCMSTWWNVDFLQYTHTPHTRKHTHTQTPYDQVRIAPCQPNQISTYLWWLSNKLLLDATPYFTTSPGVIPRHCVTWCMRYMWMSVYIYCISCKHAKWD